MVSVNVDVVCCKIKIPHRTHEDKILYSPVLGAESIKNAISQVVQDSGIVDVIKIDKWVLKLDAIPEAQFDTLFIPRLVQTFAEHFAHVQASIAGQHEVKTSTSNAAMLLSEPHVDDEELFQLARCCLTPATFKTLLQDSSTEQLQRSLKLLLEGAWPSPKIVPVFWYDRVTVSRLSIAAALYLLNRQQGADWLMSQHSPTASQVTDWAKAIARGEIPPEQVAQLLISNGPANSVLPAQPAYSPLLVMRWLLPLWRQPAVRQVIHRLEGGRGVQRLDAYLSRCLQRQDNQAMREEKEMHIVALSSGQDISNAGLLLLWPLLPQLFSQLRLWEEKQFVSDTARWQAVHCLDRLVWGEANPTDARLTLNQVLCGVSLLTPVPQAAPLSVLQQQQIDDWLAAIGQQLASWQKLSLTDIRQLFLQRAGEISTEGTFPQIRVHPEPYDYLLRDWPWPMTLASFPWTEQPLTIVWPLNGFTG